MVALFGSTTGLGSAAGSASGLGAGLNNTLTRLGGYLGLGSGLAGETMLGTEAAQAAMSGTQAGTLSALGSGGAGGSLAATAPAYSALQIAGPVALAAGMSAFHPIIDPITRGIGSIFGMGGGSNVTGRDFLDAYMNGVPGGTPIGNQVMPSNITNQLLSSWLGVNLPGTTFSEGGGKYWSSGYNQFLDDIRAKKYSTSNIFKQLSDFTTSKTTPLGLGA